MRALLAPLPWLRLCLFLAVQAWAPCALADVQRFALVVGNNAGASADEPLRYAEDDAQKMHDVLRDVGGFAPGNIVLLRGENRDVFRTTLISLNDRLRSAASTPATETFLFVYYSGHADASSLHVGAESFALAELAQLVRGSSATFRLLVVDACRSGALTRLKGGRVVEPFALRQDATVGGEGFAFLTATSPSEDAQESDEIKGSFFTNALVSGMLGAADTDGDGAVVLDEAYRYAYDATLRATSRTYAGLQHPSVSFSFRAQSALVLTRVRVASPSRAALQFPPGYGFLVMKDHADGPVVAEVGARDVARTLSVRAGRYFVRGRGTDVMLEGPIEAVAGVPTAVDVDRLQKVQYARLVRKGERVSAFAHGPEIGGTLRTARSGEDGLCPGFAGGYRFEFEKFTLTPRLGLCFTGYQNEVVTANAMQFDLTLAAGHVWDWPIVSVGLGLGGGVAYVRQTFETKGEAPSRGAAFPLVFLEAQADFDVAADWYLGPNLRAETHFPSVQQSSTEEPERRAEFALRIALLVGKRF
jgi:hypothetical protein